MNRKMANTRVTQVSDIVLLVVLSFGDDLPKEEQVFSHIAVLRRPLLPRHEKAAGEIEQSAD